MDDGRGPVEITDEMERAAVRAQGKRALRRALILALVVTGATLLL